jgi:hypothetical protein
MRSPAAIRDAVSKAAARTSPSIPMKPATAIRTLVRASVTA